MHLVFGFSQAWFILDLFTVWWQSVPVLLLSDSGMTGSHSDVLARVPAFHC